VAMTIVTFGSSAFRFYEIRDLLSCLTIRLGGVIILSSRS
jgi:hypothetical protein